MLGQIYRVTTAANNADSTYPGGTVAVYVGTTGDLKVDFWGEGSEITIEGLNAGIWHEINIKKIYGTGTTAGDILVAY